MRQISQDFSELSTQLTGVARDLQEEMLQEALRTGQSAQGQPGDQPQSPQGMALAGMRKRLPRPGAGTRKHVFVLSEAGEACVLPLRVRGGTFQHHGRHGGPGCPS